MIQFNIERQETYSRGLLLLRTFLGIFYIWLPHYFVILFLYVGSSFVQLFSFFAILFSGKLPEGFFNYQLGFLRYISRLNATAMNMTDRYPTFGFNDPESNVHVEQEYKPERSRGLALLRFIFGFFYILIPHSFVLFFISLASNFCVFISWWAILITGKYPESLFRFIEGSLRWNMRIFAYMVYLTDTYPPFSMK